MPDYMCLHAVVTDSGVATCEPRVHLAGSTVTMGRQNDGSYVWAAGPIGSRGGAPDIITEVCGPQRCRPMRPCDHHTAVAAKYHSRLDSD